VDEENQQIEGLDDAAKDPYSLLVPLYKYYEGAVSRFVIKSGHLYGCEALPERAEQMQTDQWYNPPEIMYALELVIRYRKANQKHYTYDPYDAHPHYTSTLQRALDDFLAISEDIAKFGLLARPLRYSLHAVFDHGRPDKCDCSSGFPVSIDSLIERVQNGMRRGIARSVEHAQPASNRALTQVQAGFFMSTHRGGRFPLLSEAEEDPRIPLQSR
jgi:hypothetical protein